MRKFKLIKEYPDSPELGTELIEDDSNTRSSPPEERSYTFLYKNGEKKDVTFLYKNGVKNTLVQNIEKYSDFWKEIVPVKETFTREELYPIFRTIVWDMSGNRCSPTNDTVDKYLNKERT